MTDINKWIVEAHGKLAQLMKLGEECSELSAAISEFAHLRASKIPVTEVELNAIKLEIHEEFGDVKNLVEQMVYVLYKPASKRTEYTGCFMGLWH